MNFEKVIELMSKLDASSPEEAIQKLRSMSADDQNRILSKAFQDVGLHPFDKVIKECEEKRHLPLARTRDQPGEPWVNLVCNGCGKIADSPQEFKQCTQCKAVKYCSRDCQIRDWKGQGDGVTKPRSHKDMCAELALCKQEFRDNAECGEAIRKKIFSSWADQHHEHGSFFHAEFLARRGVLGQLEVGFWAQPATTNPYMASGKDTKGFENGDMLLKEKFPSLKEGWKVLEDDEFPSYIPPNKNLLPADGIRCWEEYFHFRQLSPTSIAPLLLTNVLTIYQMLHYELELTKQPSQKKKLLVYLLGVETELNYIPLFSELAFLMPSIDLTLVMMSPAAKAICDKAKASFPKSILSKSPDFTVLDFKDESGGGRIRIQLNSEASYFHEIRTFFSFPDAILGLNAGLASYPTWNLTMVDILRSGKVPFSFSDQTKITCRFDEVLWFPRLVQCHNANRPPRMHPIDIPSTKIKLNPFHGVVNRDIEAVLVPNINNGYIITWKP